LAAICFSVAIEVLLLLGGRIAIVAQGTLGFLAKQAAAVFAGRRASASRRFRAAWPWPSASDDVHLFVLIIFFYNFVCSYSCRDQPNAQQCERPDSIATTAIGIEQALDVPV
jgi:hypothetical protein